MYILDTNVVSEFRLGKRANPDVMAWSKNISSAQLYLSAITLLEISIGIQRLTRKDAGRAMVLQEWFLKEVVLSFEGRIFPVDTAAALACAALHVPVPRPAHDALIAATALVHNLTLVTRNTKDFEDIGVRLFNPWS
jgi:predicted nucleic acid-binding protein